MFEAGKDAASFRQVGLHNLGQLIIWNTCARAVAYGPDPLKYKMASIPFLSSTVNCFLGLLKQRSRRSSFNTFQQDFNSYATAPFNYDSAN